MRKSLIYILFSLAFVFLFPSSASADVIPPWSHWFSRCVKVVNLDEFPDIVLIGYVTGPMITGSEINQIKNNECLSKGYKFNTFKIYWNTKYQLVSIGPTHLLLDDVRDDVNVDGGWVDQNNPLVEEDIEYSIAGFSGGNLILYKSKLTSEYNNGIPNKVETFANPLKIPYPTVVSLTASPATIGPGQTVTLTWSTSNASSVTISQLGQVLTSGSTTVTPSTTTRYTLTATGDSGTVPATSTIWVEVNTVRPGWSAPSISVEKIYILRGNSTTLSWDAPGAKQVTISDAGTFGPSGSTAVSPEKTTRYNLTATYSDGTSQSALVTVYVESVQPPYLLYGLIGLLALAAAVIVYFLVKKFAVRPAVQSGNIQSVSTVQPASPVSTTPSSTLLDGTSPATAVADGSPTTIAAPPARFMLAGGGEILLAGSARSYGRDDFKGLTTVEKSGLLSREHLVVSWDNGHYYIEDRGSANGTKVNGVEIRGTSKRALRDGDVIDLANEISMTFKM